MSKKNTNPSHLDIGQIQRLQYDQETDSMRVTIVSGQVPDIKVSVDSEALTKAIQEGMAAVPVAHATQIPVQVIETEKVIVQRESVIHKIEVPVVIKEIEYREMKVFVEVPKIVEVEKPVIVTELREVATRETHYLRAACVAQALLILFLLLKR